LWTAGWYQERARLRVSTLFVGASLLPIWIAQDQGHFKNAGVDIELISMQSNLSTSALLAGEVHGDELSISSFILARLRGVPLKALPVFLSRRFRLCCMYFRVNFPVNHKETAKEYPAQSTISSRLLKRQTLWQTDIATKNKKRKRLGKRK
jgi:NMT1/THI5 like